MATPDSPGPSLFVYIFLVDETTVAVVPSRRRISESDKERIKNGEPLNTAFESYLFGSEDDRTRFRTAVQIPGVHRVDIDFSRQGVRSFWLRIDSASVFLANKDALGELLQARISTWLGVPLPEVIYAV